MTLHGRHRSEKGHSIAGADWDAIRIVKARIGIPVIANGGIETFEDIQRCLEYTGADAVMSSEAILEKPYLFSGKTYNHLDMFEEYLDIVRLYPEQSPCCIRAHAFKMLYRYCQKHTDLREQLTTAHSIDQFEQIVANFRAKVPEDAQYTQPEVSWYRRHRNTEEIKSHKSTATSYDEHLDDGLNNLFGG